MKKIFFAVMALTLCVFTSCKKSSSSAVNSELERCWEITTTLGGISTSTYEWGTEMAIQFQVAAIKAGLAQQNQVVINVDYKPASYTDKNSCQNQNQNQYTDPFNQGGNGGSQEL